MDTFKNKKKVLPRVYLKRGLNQSRKEVNMTTKGILKIVICAVLVVVALLGIEVISSKSAADTISASTMTREKLVGSDYIERHPTVIRPANYYIGSDWIERHPTVVRPANYYIGSDWIERHPTVMRPANYYFGSDWIERRPQDPYAGSDWIERHPSPTDSIDIIPCNKIPPIDD